MINREIQTTSLFTKEQIQEKIKAIADDINKKYKGQEVLAVGILTGAFVFYSELLKNLTCDVVCDFCAISFYGQSMRPKEETCFSLDIAHSIKGKHVLLIDCIADHGHSLNFVQSHIKQRNPKSLHTAILVAKPQAMKVAHIDSLGFKIKQDIFLVGFGIDYKQQGRQLPHFAEVSLN